MFNQSKISEKVLKAEQLIEKEDKIKVLQSWYDNIINFPRISDYEREYLIDAVEKFMSVGTSWKFQEFFEDSFLLQFYWENDFEMIEREKFNLKKKISFFQLVKKYFSKKVRSLI